jgi:hypothetical protein
MKTPLNYLWHFTVAYGCASHGLRLDSNAMRLNQLGLEFDGSDKKCPCYWYPAMAGNWIDHGRVWSLR